MIFLSKYWYEIGSILCIMGLVGFLQYKDNKILRLENKVSLYEIESERLYNEYQNNILQYNEAKVSIHTVYVDKIRYIKESVDENASCENVIDSINKYSF